MILACEGRTAGLSVLIFAATANTEGTPSFAYFAKRGIANVRMSTRLPRPLKERKDGPTTVSL
jgi:hypothetical protein